MARSFTAASLQYMETLNTLTTFITASTGSFSVWYYPTSTSPSAANARSLPCLINDSSSNMGMSRGTIGGNDRIWIWNWDGNEDRTNATYSTNTWQHFGWMHSGGTVSIYKNGALVEGVASGNTAGSGADMRSGYGYTGGNYLNGRLAEMAFWNVALTDSEWASLGLGYSPALIRPSSRTAYWPLLGFSSPELCVNNHALAWTLTNSPAAAEHSSVFYPGPPSLGYPGAVVTAAGLPVQGKKGLQTAGQLSPGGILIGGRI